MKFFRKLITFGLLGMICSPIYSADSTENTLNVAEENSVPKVYPQNVIDVLFKNSAKQLNQNFQAFRGDFWEPRPFWSQPIGEIEHYLLPVLKKHNVYPIICEMFYDDFQVSGYPYPEGLEDNLENDVEEKLKDFAREHGIDPNGYNFKDSLMIGRNPEDHIDYGWTIEIVKTTPLLSYFDILMLYESIEEDGVFDEPGRFEEDYGHIAEE